MSFTCSSISLSISTLTLYFSKCDIHSSFNIWQYIHRDTLFSFLLSFYCSYPYHRLLFLSFSYRLYCPLYHLSLITSCLLPLFYSVSSLWSSLLSILLSIIISCCYISRLTLLSSLPFDSCFLVYPTFFSSRSYYPISVPLFLTLSLIFLYLLPLAVQILTLFRCYFSKLLQFSTLARYLHLQLLSLLTICPFNLYLPIFSVITAR